MFDNIPTTPTGSHFARSVYTCPEHGDFLTYSLNGAVCWQCPANGFSCRLETTWKGYEASGALRHRGCTSTTEVEKFLVHLRENEATDIQVGADTFTAWWRDPIGRNADRGFDPTRALAVRPA
jgi:hypothetical protein